MYSDIVYKCNILFVLADEMQLLLKFHILKLIKIINCNFKNHPFKLCLKMFFIDLIQFSFECGYF